MCTAKRYHFIRYFHKLLKRDNLEQQDILMQHADFMHSFRPDRGQSVERQIQGMERPI